MMISLHGYVAAEPELGKPDTGGQVVYVLELAKRFVSRLGWRVDLITRRFEDQPEFDKINDNLRVWRIAGGSEFIRKEDMHDRVGDFVTNLLAAIRTRNFQYDIVNSHYWDAGWAGQKVAEELNIPHIHTPHSLGWWKQQNLGADMSAKEMEKNVSFEERIRKVLVYQMCDHVIATTEPQAELLCKSMTCWKSISPSSRRAWMKIAFPLFAREIGKNC
ncbi:MAG: glycosyltransferase [Chloroflexi bacterium]|nr:glycosyltransferase [Chloroflexota bacterium]